MAFGPNTRRVELNAAVVCALSVVAVVGALLPVRAWAVPANPRLLEAARRDAALALKLRLLEKAARAKGVNAGAGRSKAARGVAAGSLTGAGLPAARGPSGAYRALALVVDFSDRPAQVAPAFFDSLIFAETTGPASVRGYWREVSYGRLDIVTLHGPGAIGWLRLPRTSAYYANGGAGLGPYPTNAQKMVEDAVDAADAVVDFSDYDNDGDGVVDALLVVHAGPGYEFTGDYNDIWSHQWEIPSRAKDGVYVRTYSTEPEYYYSPGDMTIGVYAHELGHVFGLPDLYDTDYSSRGIGDWSLMASGSWNGVTRVGGDLPARPDAFSAQELGFLTPVDVTATIDGAFLPSVNARGESSVYRMRANGAISGPEYFLVENRQKTGTDAGLPGQGLLVWHVDETQPNNNNESRFLVDLEEAHGGTQHLAAHTANRGDANDPYPGATAGKVSFTGLTDPSSRLNGGTESFVKIEGISASGPTMTASLTVTQQPVPPLPPGEPEATSLTCYRSASRVGFAGSTTLFGTLSSTDGQALPLRFGVSLWRSNNWTSPQALWVKAADADYRLSGELAGYYAATSPQLVSNTAFQLRYEGEQGAYLPSTSRSVLVLAKAWLSRPASSMARPRPGVAFTVSGRLRPKHSGKTRVEFHRLVRGRYVVYRWAYGDNSAILASTSRYALRYRLPRGSWRIRARHWDSGHDRTYSPWLYVSVR